MFIVSDLDGTLVEKDKAISDENRLAFKEVRSLGGLSAIATGRSLFGVQTELAADFPLDYLIFSSGAGIYDWKKQELVHKTVLSGQDVHQIFSFLKSEGLDFTIQLEAPDSHRFYHSAHNPTNSDFMDRLSYHHEHSSPLFDDSLPSGASEFIVIEKAEQGLSTLDKIKTKLENTFNIVRATSPFDGNSMWIEIFHKSVSKGNAAEWVRKKHELPKNKTFALGNDYNDLQLLAWANNPLVVKTAAAELLDRYTNLEKSIDLALSEALEKWGIKQ